MPYAVIAPLDPSEKHLHIIIKRYRLAPECQIPDVGQSLQYQIKGAKTRSKCNPGAYVFRQGLQWASPGQPLLSRHMYNTKQTELV